MKTKLKVSDIEFQSSVRVATPEDAYQLVWNSWSARCYISNYGDVEICWDAEYKVFRVPAFAQKRAEFYAAKSSFMEDNYSG